MTVNVYLRNAKRDIEPWILWLEDNVGELGEGWGWYDSIQGCFICFDNAEDASAFKLRFGL